MTTRVSLKNVRLFFNDLFVAKQFEGAGEFKYGAKFGVEPGSDNHKAILAAIETEGKAKFEKKWPTFKESLPHDKKSYPYINGDSLDFEGAEGVFVLTAKRKQKDGPPAVLNKDKTDIREEDGKIYSGCYVNASVEIWGQNNTHKGIRCTLRGVQFFADGDAFSGGGKVSKDEFDDLGSDDSAFDDESNDLG